MAKQIEGFDVQLHKEQGNWVAAVSYSIIDSADPNYRKGAGLRYGAPSLPDSVEALLAAIENMIKAEEDVA